MFEFITHWFDQHQALLLGMSIASALMFVLSVIFLPWLLGKIPVDYFQHQPDSQGLARLLTPRPLFRNLLGLPVLLAGVAMLVLPGQGFLTILLGLAIMDFPGKYKLVRWVAQRRGVLQSINWIRGKSGHPPLAL